MHRLNATIVPIAHMTFLRPDGHRVPNDSLHYEWANIGPSVVNAWIYVFYNLLLNDKNINNITDLTDRMY